LLVLYSSRNTSFTQHLKGSPLAVGVGMKYSTSQRLPPCRWRWTEILNLSKAPPLPLALE